LLFTPPHFTFRSEIAVGFGFGVLSLAVNENYYTRKMYGKLYQMFKPDTYFWLVDQLAAVVVFLFFVFGFAFTKPSPVLFCSGLHVAVVRVYG
jgi:hypothetical protein